MTTATTENILRKLQGNVSQFIYSIDTEICYNLDCVCDFTKEENEVYSSIDDYNYVDYAIYVK